MRTAFCVCTVLFLYYLFFLLVGLGPQSSGYGGSPLHFVFAKLRDEEPYGAPAGGCRANNVCCPIVISTLVLLYYILAE